MTAPPPSTPALRLKSRWFKSAATRSPAEQASAMAFIVWRIARKTLERMRGARFDIATGPAYFAFLREVLAFLVAVTDRLAHARLSPDARAAFTGALVHHLARTLQDNEDELLGPPPPGTAGVAASFIDLVNTLAPHYAEFGAAPTRAAPTDRAAAPPASAVAPASGRGDAGCAPDSAPDFAPDFTFVRYFGHRLEATLPAPDRLWVIDQVMAVEAPEAVALVQRAMRELYDPAPRRERGVSVSGD